MRRSVRIGLVVAMAAAPFALRAQPAPGQIAPPNPNSPEYDFRKHQPNPATVTARERALGLPTNPDPNAAKEVDQIFRELTTANPDPLAPNQGRPPAR